MTDNEEDIKGFLDKLPKRYQNLEKRIDEQVKTEFLELSSATGRRELLEKEVIVLSRALDYPTGDVIMKKRALVILSNTGSIVGFRHIEQYYKNPDKELRQWSALALNHCLLLIKNNQLVK